MKKMLVCLLAALMVATSSVASYAATSQSSTKNYSVSLSTSNIEFVKNGKSSSYDISKGNVTITKSSSGGLSVQFPLASGGSKKITLGAQSALTLNGSIDTLKIDSKVNKDAVITVASKASITTLNVDAPCKVIVDGSASTINITDSDAKVVVSDTAKVSSVTTASKASISGVADSKITVSSKKASTTTKTTTTTEEDEKPEDKLPTISITNLTYNGDSVTFECDVEDAIMSIDNKSIGKTVKGSNVIDFTFDKDSPIDYKLVISKEGYQDAYTTLLFGGYYIKDI